MLIINFVFQKLTKSGADSWSLAEVVHAIVILTHFHSLCSFVFSCGVNEEIDQGTATDTKNQSDDPSSAIVPISHHSHSSSSNSATTTNSNHSEPKQIVNDTRQQTTSQSTTSTSTVSTPGTPPEPEVGIVTLMARMKTLSERAEECTQTELTKRFEHVESQSAELGMVPQPSTEVAAEISQFIDDPMFIYHDFAKRDESSDIQTFRVHDYSWDDHGYSLVNR